MNKKTSTGATTPLSPSTVLVACEEFLAGLEDDASPAVSPLLAAVRELNRADLIVLPAPKTHRRARFNDVLGLGDVFSGSGGVVLVRHLAGHGGRWFVLERRYDESGRAWSCSSRCVMDDFGALVAVGG